MQAEVLAADDVEQHAGSAGDVDVEQRAGDRRLRAASTARSAPRPRPMASSAGPASPMILRTSAKSRLMMPGRVMTSLMPWMAWQQDVVRGAQGVLEAGLGVAHREQAVVGDDDQRVDLLAQGADALFGTLRHACCPRS